jgi:hypothetical protein
MLHKVEAEWRRRRQAKTPPMELDYLLRQVHFVLGRLWAVGAE